MTNREALLRKLKALSERGEGGEAINATEKLKQLLNQYGMDESDLEDEAREQRTIKYGTGQFDKRLIDQVIYMVMGDVLVYYQLRNGKKVPNVLIVECTMAEQIEIQAAYEFYQHHLNVGLEKYCEAFIQRENIFPDATKKQGKPTRSVAGDEEIARLYHSIDKHDRNPQLEAGSRGRTNHE